LNIDKPNFYSFLCSRQRAGKNQHRDGQPVLHSEPPFLLIEKLGMAEP
jgi:hypothetical protein